MNPDPSAQRHLARQALSCLRSQLRPSLSAGQQRSAAFIERCLSQIAAEPTAARASAAAPTPDLGTALQRLDQVVSRRLHSGRLDAPTRRYLREQLDLAARDLVTGRPDVAP